jgi:ABC-2 type transport system permease protein
MFSEIFLFEVRNRIRRPAIYIYFLAILAFTLASFSTGSLPVLEKEHINAPYLISFWTAAMTMLMSLAASSIMGSAIFRDIEFQTKDYYLTYPITKAGYFWGRFAGAFFFIVLIALAIPLGVWLSTYLGPAIGKSLPEQFGPNKPMFLFYPFLTLGLPNIFFTSALFFGLVAVLRNVKVIYFGGLMLFLCYFMALFFLGHSNNATVIGVADPFALTWVRNMQFNSNYLQQNKELIPVTGPLLYNRLVWTGVGLAILLITYFRFNFEKFFAGRRDKAMADEVSDRSKVALKTPAISFSGRYNRRVLRSLVKLELFNIIRDNYFWVIVGAGSAFLGFVFWMGVSNGDVAEYPRTVQLLAIFADAFPFFIFFIILFYTGETLQRDRLTRYAFINDSLPPPNWVLNGSKLIPLLMLSAGLSAMPLLIGIAVQLAKGYTHLQLNLYFTYLFLIILPKFLTGAVFCYVIQVIFNNKFAGYALVVPVWIGMFFLDSTGTFNYRLLLYSYTPNTGLSDMDGMGHMMWPVFLYDVYWLLGAGLLVVIAALLFHRGVNSSFKERRQLIPERFNVVTRWIGAVLLAGFLAVGGYIYYNVSYLNVWLTHNEEQDRAILYEKALKKYQALPLPVLTSVVSKIDLYPVEKRAMTDAMVTIQNQTDQPIAELLLDADGLTDYSVTQGGLPVPMTYPLRYLRGSFSWFRPAYDTADFRLYRFAKPLAPGDSMVLEVRSEVRHEGFENGLYLANMLNNGTAFNGGLPGLGYDDDDEVSSPYVRKAAGLPPKVEKEWMPNEPQGMNRLKAGVAAHLHRMDLTVSVPDDETAICEGELIGKWTANGRHYFHYLADRPGMYPPFIITAARYSVKRDSILLDHPVGIEIYYNPDQAYNLDRYLAAIKDGLRYYSRAYGSYPYRVFRQAEVQEYGPREAALTSLSLYKESNGWNAHFTNPNQRDFLFIDAERALAQQWWRFQVAPNNTMGSLVVSEGLANYDAFVMAARKYGADNMRDILRDHLWGYIYIRRRLTDREHPVLTANEWFEWGQKAGFVLYGLHELIGEERMNAALREFRDSFAFRTHGPYAGSTDLYEALKRQVPDSLQYYLTDTWEKVTLYDSKVLSVDAVKTGNPDEWRVTMKVSIDKIYKDDKGSEVPATGMNDFIDIGVMGADKRDSLGRMGKNFLYLKRQRLTRGEHVITVVVKGKPEAVGVDPVGLLMDQRFEDNVKRIGE